MSPRFKFGSDHLILYLLLDSDSVVTIKSHQDLDSDSAMTV